MIRDVGKTAGRMIKYYYSDLFDDIRNIKNWYPIGGQEIYEHGVHKFTVTDDLVTYEKKNIGKLSIETHHKYDDNEERWLELFLLIYHDESHTLYINPSNNWQELFSGMDISERLFTYIGSGNIEFGDLAIDILNERPPRYVYIAQNIRLEEFAQYEHLLEGILYVSCPEIYWLEQGLFPNFERANVAHRNVYLNNNFEYPPDEAHYSGVEYLLRLPSRGATNKR